MENPKSKLEVSQRLFVLLIVALVGLLMSWGFDMYQIYNTAHTGGYPREITVEGLGKAYAIPDIAEITLGVDTKEKTADKAITANTEKMNKVIASLKELGIEKKDIQTTSYSLNQDYRYTELEGSVPDGYLLSQSVIVKVRDLTKTGDVMSKATSVGANMIGSIQFKLEDTEKVKELARQEGIKQAKAKATSIADATGLDLGKVINYYEYEDNYYDYDYGKGGGGVMMEAADTKSAPAPTIEPGQQETNLRVSVTYRLD